MPCDFGSPALLKLRREIANNEAIHPIVRAELVMAINNLRLRHEDDANCRCWYEAVNTAMVTA